jgi:hypothetical protein
VHSSGSCSPRGETVVRVAPKLSVRERTAARERGKSDVIDAVAIARTALREALEKLPVARLAGPELDARLLVDHREPVVASAPRSATTCRPLATDAKLGRSAGSAPIPASSRRTQRHRLDHGGNRQLNCALHRLAITKGRLDPESAAYLARRQAKARPAAKPSAASSATSPAASGTSSNPTPRPPSLPALQPALRPSSRSNATDRPARFRRQVRPNPPRSVRRGLTSSYGT